MSARYRERQFLRSKQLERRNSAQSRNLGIPGSNVGITQSNGSNGNGPNSPRSIHGGGGGQWWNSSFNTANSNSLPADEGGRFGQVVGRSPTPLVLNSSEHTNNDWGWGGTSPSNKAAATPKDQKEMDKKSLLELEKKQTESKKQKHEKHKKKGLTAGLSNGNPIRDRPLEPSQIDDLKELFNTFDIEGKERITPEGLMLFMETLGVQKSLTEWKQVILTNISLPAPQREDEVEGEFGMTFEDFIIFYFNQTKDLTAAMELKETFRVMDDNADGLVEIQKVLLLFDILGRDTSKIGALNNVEYLKNDLYQHFTKGQRHKIPPETFWESFQISYHQFIDYIEYQDLYYNFD